MKLYTYFRSSAAYRVRIALNLKGLDYEALPVHLLRNGGEQLTDAYRAINPSALLPITAADRARVRALALTVAADTHPLGNLRVLKYLKHDLNVSEEVKLEWQRHWLRIGMATLETMLSGDARTGRYCHGDTPTLADCCLVPQVFGAQRFGVELAPYPTVMRIHDACAGLPAFHQAHPSQQPDTE